MSEDWYRGPLDLPLYETAGPGTGSASTPMQGCEPPQWYWELVWMQARAECMMRVAEYAREYGWQH